MENVPSNQTIKHLSGTALVFMGVLLVASMAFYRERVLFADTAGIAFHIINNGTFSIIGERYGSFITQLLPWAMQHMHFAVRAVLIGYNVNFFLFFLSVATMLHFKFRQYRLSVVLACYFFLMVSQSFFLANDEIHEGVAWLFLMLGWVLYLGERGKPLWLVVLPLLSLGYLALTCHFLVIIPMLFVPVYLVLEKDNWPFTPGKTAVLSGLFLLLLGSKMLLRQPVSYDKICMRQLMNISTRDMYEAFEHPVIIVFLQRCVTNYWLAVLLFGSSMVSLWLRRRRLLALYCIVAFYGYMLLMGVVYAEAPASFGLFHIETEWQCLSIILALPVVSAVLIALPLRTAQLLFVAIFAVRLGYIFQHYPIFHERLVFEEKVIARMKEKGITKMAFVGSDKNTAELVLDWVVPCESTLLSALAHDKPQRTFCYIDPGDSTLMKELSGDRFCFYKAFGSLNISSMNQKYFQLDTTQVYHVVTQDQFFK